MTEHGRCMTDRPDREIRSSEGLDQTLAVLVFGEIPQRPVAARIEDRIESIDGHIGQLQRRRKLLLRPGIGLEAAGVVRLRTVVIA